MKQARILIEEINNKVRAIKKTNSPQLKKDYYKSIKNDKRELKEYCKNKNLDYKELSNEILKF